MYDGYVIFDHTICKYGGLNMPVLWGIEETHIRVLGVVVLLLLMMSGDIETAGNKAVDPCVSVCHTVTGPPSLPQSQLPISYAGS